MKHPLLSFLFLALVSCAAPEFGVEKAPITKVVEMAFRQETAQVYFGGSFDPPTKSHLRLLVRTMNEQAFLNGNFIVAIPYKGESEEMGVNLELTRVALSELRSILDLEKIPYKNFKQENPNLVSWTGSDDLTYRVRVSDFEYANGIRENTVETLTKLGYSTPGGAENLFWIAGADVLSSITTWPDWQKLFTLSHWVFLPRGDQTARSTDLMSKFPSTFTSQYQKTYFGNSWFYRNRNEMAPHIFVLDQAVIPGSSTEVRKMIRSGTATQKDLSEFLTPRVIERIQKKNYYRRPKSKAKAA